MLKSSISPSLMCADIFNLENIIADMEKSSIEYLHIDVMDGDFVPNFCLGSDYCRRMKARTDIPLDIHLMVTGPADKLGVFPFSEGDVVSVHYESDSEENTVRALKSIREKGAKPFSAKHLPRIQEKHNGAQQEYNGERTSSAVIIEITFFDTSVSLAKSNSPPAGLSFLYENLKF